MSLDIVRSDGYPKVLSGIVEPDRLETIATGTQTIPRDDADQIRKKMMSLATSALDHADFGHSAFKQNFFREVDGTGKKLDDDDQTLSGFEIAARKVRGQNRGWLEFNDTENKDLNGPQLLVTSDNLKGGPRHFNSATLRAQMPDGKPLLVNSTLNNLSINYDKTVNITSEK